MPFPRWPGLLALGVLAAGLLPARTADEDAVQKAIDRGVAALKRAAAPRFHPTGSASLVGLTLLECGVKPDDAAVVQRADEVRKASVDLNHTYSLGLAIMFLDRLGDPNDSPFVQSMGVRLLAGQNNAGGWSYNCPAPSEEEIRRLNSVYGQRSEQLQLQKYQQTKPDPLRAPPPLPEAVKELIRKIKPAPAENNLFGMGDNSNTQFAILGLWASRRHGIPIDRAMLRVADRFRRSQNGDGGWSYASRGGLFGNSSSGAMTCAGLLGLAMHIGTANEAILRTDPKTPAIRLPRDPAKDANVRAGLLALGTTIGSKPNGPGVVAPGVIGPGFAPKGPRGAQLNKGFYFLWSVERVAVAYGLKTIGKKDWYAWGSEILLDSQKGDGTWHGEYGPEIDTCFALLFLRKANVAPDLSHFLKGRVDDPGEVALKAGGVGGEALVKSGLQSGIVWNQATEAIVEFPEVTKLKQELLKAPPDQQGKLIDRLKEDKGAVNTLALAAAIPQLEDPARTKARDALAERLTRMTATTLRDKLQESDAEIRRAAALACAMKDDKTYIADLVGLLDDAEVQVVRAALVGLQHLTGQDLGAHAKPAERAKTVGAWKEWWRKQEP